MPYASVSQALRSLMEISIAYRKAMEAAERDYRATRRAVKECRSDAITNVLVGLYEDWLRLRTVLSDVQDAVRAASTMDS